MPGMDTIAKLIIKKLRREVRDQSKLGAVDALKQEGIKGGQEGSGGGVRIAVTPQKEGEKAHCPNCGNISEFHKSLTGEFSCSICGWKGGQTGPESSGKKVKRALKNSAFAIIAIILGFITVATGMLPISKWYTWIFILSILWFCASSFVAIAKHKEGEYKWYLGPTSVTISIFIIAVIFAWNANVLTVGPIANILKYENINVEHGSFGAYFSDGWVKFKCGTGLNGFFNILSGNIDISQKRDVDPDCAPPLIEDAKNIQTESKDVVIDSFTASDTRIIPGSTVSVTVNLKNIAKNDIPISVYVKSPTEAQFLLDTAPRSGSTCNYDVINNACTFILSAGITTPLIWTYKLNSNEKYSGQANFKAGISYRANVSTLLSLQTTTELQERGKNSIESEASAGSANFILAAQNQPLYHDDPFLFSYTLKNNNEFGLILEAKSYVFIPSDIVNEAQAYCSKSDGVTYTIMPTNDLKCKDLTKKFNGNYFCIENIYNTVDINGKDAPIKDSVKVSCRLNAKSNIITKTAIGRLEYAYASFATTGVLIDQKK